MILHALLIILNELNSHLSRYYDSPSGGIVETQAKLGNLAEGFANSPSGSGVSRDALILSIVNIKEEKTLKNLPNYVRHTDTLTAAYQNPPLFLNFQLLLSATHTNYEHGLSMLSRAIRFFQHKNTFTQDNVSPASLMTTPPQHPLDQLEEFKLILDLYSPTMEEVNHLWGTLGGKQSPFILYNLRMLDLKFVATYQPEAPLVTEIINEFHHKPPSGHQNV